jgi:hypothetical protein
VARLPVGALKAKLMAMLALEGMLRGAQSQWLEARAQIAAFFSAAPPGASIAELTQKAEAIQARAPALPTPESLKDTLTTTGLLTQAAGTSAWVEEAAKIKDRAKVALETLQGIQRECGKAIAAGVEIARRKQPAGVVAAAIEDATDALLLGVEGAGAGAVAPAVPAPEGAGAGAVAPAVPAPEGAGAGAVAPAVPAPEGAGAGAGAPGAPAPEEGGAAEGVAEEEAEGAPPAPAGAGAGAGEGGADADAEGDVEGGMAEDAPAAPAGAGGAGGGGGGAPGGGDRGCLLL